jgi:hypothetical protein
MLRDPKSNATIGFIGPGIQLGEFGAMDVHLRRLAEVAPQGGSRREITVYTGSDGSISSYRVTDFPNYAPGKPANSEPITRSYNRQDLE